ncbi:lysosomal acid glucosylceramidase-like isoform X2 [Frieseomelitta varia]|uniref:lysosomal acid glucosylceramidase-like isoform X2 n=1 Tax=Frieseomelitta varia TaxID=561572 RepID=UPI001CB688CA|nr:lysosomal acid glucosylceramidase-like isoform X2 [Frieseomelitta varia]
MLLIAGNTQANDCVPRELDFGIVCVCNATYCDDTPDNNPRIPENGSVYWYVSSKGGLRLNLSQAHFNSCEASNDTPVLTVDPSRRYQTIFGFGGAFTDSTGINIGNLSRAAQDQIIRTYFGRNGSRYSLGRIPIGGTDFSTRPYTYDDSADDVSLRYFSLAPEDYNYKIPYIRRAIELNPDLRFFSSAWSAPAWMKTNQRINGLLGFLERRYYGTYVDYLIRFLQEYRNNGINVWGISTGNEPFNAFVPFDRLNVMAWTPRTVSEWVADYAGPMLENSEFNGTKLLLLDDQRFELPWVAAIVFQNPKAKRYISGTAVHWYFDQFFPSSILDTTHNLSPDKFILMTEACTGDGMLDYPKVALGSWERGQEYILSIIEYMNHWGIGWIDWNLVLNKQGGPNWIANYVDAPIIVNPETDEFFKQPMYYALKHFSRFVERGSVRININNNLSSVKSTAFVTPSNEVVVVLYNRSNREEDVVLEDPNNGPVCLTLLPYSINTIIYAQ